MTTTTEEKDLTQFAGKKVTVVRNLKEPDKDGNTTVEVEGHVQVVNALGLLIKPKGKVQFELIEKDEIEDVFVAPEKDKALKVSKIKPVKEGLVRRHLLDRHGLNLGWVNSVTEEEAKTYHNSLDHVELDLGHVHVDKDESAGDESDDDTDDES